MNAKFVYLSMSLATIACTLLCGLPAQAVPQFDVKFTADTPGIAPVTEPATAGGVSTKPTFVSGDTGGNSTFVQSTYVDSMTGNAFGDGNVLVFTDADVETSNALLFQGAVADETNTGIHTISLDWMEDKGVTAFSSAFIGLTNQTRGQALSSLFLDLGMDVGNIRSGNSVDFGASLGTAARGVPHHLDWVIDLDQADFSIATEVYVDGALLHVQRREPIGAPHDGASAFGNLQLAMSAPAQGVMAYDNIQIRSGRHVAGLLPGDVNNDMVVNIFDINLVSAHWGETGPVGDANNDMTVNIFDINLISANWTPTGGAANAVPEPSSAILATLGLAGLACTAVARRRRALRQQR